MTLLTSPKHLLNFLQKISPWLAVCAMGTLGLGLWLALFQSPPDYQQGETVRIMYVHVPASWLAVCVYMMMAVNSIIAFITKHPLPDLLTKAAAPMGACFTLISLGTGSLWGKPMWGAWWVWDARLTSMLILLFLYLGYFVLINAYDEESEGLAVGRFLVIIGALNIPIIKWSVDWWTTLHQPASLLRAGGVAIHPQLLMPLLMMTIAYFLIFLFVFCGQLEIEIHRRRYQALLRRQS